MQVADRERGGTLLLAVLALAALSSALFLANRLNLRGQDQANLERTDLALASAKAALIGYAVTTEMTKTGPGNLLCPNRNDDGVAYSTGAGCGDVAGQSLRLGRLPWRTLGLPDLRDASGQHLWYAVSDNFRSFMAPAATNSDSKGSITVRDASGKILYDATTGGGVAAVIIAPGAPLTRAERLTDPTARKQDANSSDPRDHLEIAFGEDNADFTDNTTNGFITGPIRAADGSLILNDRLVVITRDELLAALETRIAGELRNCLIAYAEANNDALPIPAPLSSSDYLGTPGTRFGRVPLNQLRNLKDALTTARAALETARAAIASRTSATTRNAVLAAIRATKSLAQLTALIQTTASSLQSLRGSALQSALDDAGIDPLAARLSDRAAAFSAARSTLSTSPTVTQLSTLGSAATNLADTLALISSPNVAIQSALDAERSAARNTADAANAADAITARLAADTTTAASTSRTSTINAQRTDTASSLIRNRSALLNAASDDANIRLAAIDLYASLQTVSTQSSRVLAALTPAQTATQTAFTNANSAAAANAASTALALASAIDANGDNLSVSTLAANLGTAQETAITDQLSLITSTAASAFTAADTARSLAETLLSTSNQTTTKFNDLLTRINAAQSAAALISLEAKSGKNAVIWPAGKPDCSWLNPSNYPTPGSGWVRNQWIKHLYYQIDTAKLTRNSSGDLTSGTLTLNNRSGHSLVVIAPGRALATQTRRNSFAIDSFFENANADASRSNGATAPNPNFEQRPLSEQFNDQLAY